MFLFERSGWGGTEKGADGVCGGVRQSRGLHYVGGSSQGWKKSGCFGSREHDFCGLIFFFSVVITCSLLNRGAGSGSAESLAVREVGKRELISVSFLTKPPRSVLNLLVLKYRPFLSTLIS